MYLYNIQLWSINFSLLQKIWGDFFTHYFNPGMLGTCKCYGCFRTYFILLRFLLTEGSLVIHEKGKKDRERLAFLFDTMLVLCKPTGQRKNPTSSQDYRFKEKLLIKHLDVADLEDTEGEQGAKLV